MRRMRPTSSATRGYRLHEQVGFLLRVAMQRHTAIFMARIPKRLTQTQFAAVAQLYEVGLCSQNELGRLICLDAATTKGVVDRLQSRDFVTVTRDERDRRRRAIALTPRGRAAAETAIPAAQGITAATLVPLTPREQKAVVALLKKLT
jgi:DNA-binding MarR family transcriptional regulator